MIDFHVLTWAWGICIGVLLVGLMRRDGLFIRIGLVLFFAVGALTMASNSIKKPAPVIHSKAMQCYKI